MALGSTSSDSNLYDDIFVMVASIDFGTTFSGYAFSFRSNPNDIRMNKNWGEDVGHQSFKTPSSVLVDAEGRMLAFGYTAETKYNEMILSRGEASCELYRHFKMTLHNQKHLTRETQIQSLSGKSENAMLIFTYAVTFLKDHLLEAVSKNMSRTLDPAMIRWVITVPAIWGMQAKRFMREVALMAGLIDNIDSRQFLICLEPEAAAIYCRQLAAEHLTSGEAHDINELGRQGQRYMVVDAGGGTIDITAHEVQRDGTVNELLAASGGPWGGIKVDENFVLVLIQILGRDFVLHYQRECPSEWLDLKLNFERRKKAVKPNDDDAIISLPLNCSLMEQFQEVTDKNIKQVIQTTKVEGVRFNNGHLILNAKVIRGLFKPVTSQIVAHIQKQLTSPQAAGIHLVLLAGGFAECAFVQDALTNDIDQNIRVICPSEAGISIIKGAVLFGHSPTIVNSRIARKTYAIEKLTAFDPAKHPEHKRLSHEGGDRCSVLEAFVKKGETIRMNEKRKYKYKTTSSTQTSALLTFYSADTEQAPYPDYREVTKIGTMRVEMPDTTGGRKRKIETIVYFGATEIYVEAKELRTDGKGRTADITLDFLAD